MKENFKTLATYLVLTGGLIAGNWYGVEELQRISIWGTWAFTLLCFFGVCLPSKEYFKGDKAPQGRAWIKALFAIHLVVLIATGWMFTAALYALAWFFMWLKRAAWLEEQKKATAAGE